MQETKASFDQILDVTDAEDVQRSLFVIALNTQFNKMSKTDSASTKNTLLHLFSIASKIVEDEKETNVNTEKDSNNEE
ncbi:hypothetical protein [Roseivirga spongicola]|uniref:hypothetical protein n=1 Tax=Roseivirga spongicola TaxID=333140 RepID=UPI002AC9893C|nr:hypothetical protein [Roseivirga spongicola]WPZ08788.1 hypothetical protein T7867_11015 [Roseivirga spongicola]